jgi:hypothetical protein
MHGLVLNLFLLFPQIEYLKAELERRGLATLGYRTQLAGRKFYGIFYAY